MTIHTISAGRKDTGEKRTTQKRFAVLLHKKRPLPVEMLVRICKAMTFSRRLKYKWKGNRWSVAIVAAEKSSGFRAPGDTLYSRHQCKCWAFLGLYNDCNVTTRVTRLLASVTRLRMAHFCRAFLACAPLSLPPSLLFLLHGPLQHSTFNSSQRSLFYPN